MPDGGTHSAEHRPNYCCLACDHTLSEETGFGSQAHEEELAAMGATYLPEHDCYIRYTELLGDEPLRVYLHGMGGTSPNILSSTATHPLLRGHRSLMVDLLGHGYSDTPPDFSYSVDDQARAVMAILDDIGVTSCQMIGLSLDGNVANWVAALRPEIVSHLVVLEGNLDPDVPGSASGAIVSQGEVTFVDTGIAELKQMIRQMSPDWCVVVQHLDAGAIYRSARGLVDGTVPTAREQLYDLSMPLAYLVGERSRPNPAWDELPERGIRIIDMPDAGHSMVRDNPDGMARAIAQALGVAG